MPEPTLVEKVIDTATAEVGYHESHAGGHWTNGTKYAGQVPGLEWANGQPWCAVFVSWVALKAGAAALFPRTASCDVAAAWFKTRGLWSEYPKVGSQVFYGTARDLNHTGIVIDFDATVIVTVEGNTNDSGSREGDGVYRKVRRRRDANVVGYGHPVYPAVAPPPPAPKPTRVAKARALLERALARATGERAAAIRKALARLKGLR